MGAEANHTFPKVLQTQGHPRDVFTWIQMKTEVQGVVGPPAGRVLGP